MQVLSTRVIYVDQVLLGSMVMNYAILWAAGKLGGVEKGKWRLLLSAALGGLYSIAAFFPPFPAVLSFWFKILISVLMVVIAFAPQRPFRLAVCVAFFYLASFALGGSVIGIMYLLEPAGGLAGPEGFYHVVERFFGFAVLLALGGFWLAGKGTAVLFRRRYSQGSYEVSLNLRLEGKKSELKGFIDSGNQLIDPLTGCPVIIAEFAQIKELFPREVQEKLARGTQSDPSEILVHLQNHPLSSRFTLIPFKSLGSTGVLLGFRPDEVVLLREGEVLRRSDVAVGIYYQSLSPDAAYHVLVPGILLDTVFH